VATSVRLQVRCACVALVVAATGATAQAPTVPAEVAHVVVTRPTVIAYLVVPKGAVDTLPDLAVVADDWNYAMATLGDSLEAHGVGLAMVTESRLRISSRGAPDVVYSLDAPPAAGYVLVRPGVPPCIRRTPAEPDVIVAAARAYFGKAGSRASRARVACGLTTR
jgi:hypothetical protein